jgi:hypothetical protein
MHPQYRRFSLLTLAIVRLMGSITPSTAVAQTPVLTGIVSMVVNPLVWGLAPSGGTASSPERMARSTVVRSGLSDCYANPCWASRPW